jgi:hypothetical protein
MALQFTIEKLIKDATALCGFYLITIPEILNWKEVARRHKRMLNDMAGDVRAKKLKRYAGVRVFEEGEKTHRPHAHWVLCPIIPQAKIQEYADKAGMGHVWLDPRPASPYLGMYLSKYLSKNRGSLRGVRRWSAFGEIESVKVHDVEVTSPEIELFRAHMAQVKTEGVVGARAYTEAVRRCNLSKYGHQFRDSEQATGPARKDQAMKETRTEVKTFMNSELDK